MYVCMCVCVCVCVDLCVLMPERGASRGAAGGRGSSRCAVCFVSQAYRVAVRRNPVSSTAAAVRSAPLAPPNPDLIKDTPGWIWGNTHTHAQATLRRVVNVAQTCYCSFEAPDAAANSSDLIHTHTHTRSGPTSALLALGGNPLPPPSSGARRKPAIKPAGANGLLITGRRLTGLRFAFARPSSSVKRT